MEQTDDVIDPSI